MTDSRGRYSSSLASTTESRPGSTRISYPPPGKRNQRVPVDPAVGAITLPRLAGSPLSSNCDTDEISVRPQVSA